MCGISTSSDMRLELVITKIKKTLADIAGVWVADIWVIATIIWNDGTHLQPRPRPHLLQPGNQRARFEEKGKVASVSYLFFSFLHYFKPTTCYKDQLIIEYMGNRCYCRKIEYACKTLVHIWAFTIARWVYWQQVFNVVELKVNQISHFTDLPCYVSNTKANMCSLIWKHNKPIWLGQGLVP